MKLFRKIDTITGNFIEDVLFESHPFLMETIMETVMEEDGTTSKIEKIQPVLDADGNVQLDPQYVEEAPAQGFYVPRWDGTQWVEGGFAPAPVEPEPTIDERLDSLEDVMLFLI